MKYFKTIIFLIFVFLIPGFAFGQEAKRGDVVINEVMWAGSSEWIELYNTTEKDIQFDNWSIDNAKSGGKPPEKISGKISSGSYFLICNNEFKGECNFKTSISLADSSNGDLILKDKDKSQIDMAKGDKWPAGKKTSSGSETKYYSMERINPKVSGSEKCNWTTTKTENNFLIDGKTYFGTPNERNSQFSTEDCTIFYASAGENIISVAGEEIIFDASKSKGRIETYFWNFGDGNTTEGEKVFHKYKFPGKYIVSLTVSAGEKEDSDTVEVTIFPGSIFISEFSSKEKWIEIVNESDQIQNISGFSISTKKDKIEFTFSSGTYIAPESFILLSGTQFAFSDNFVSFFYPSGDLVYKIAYNKKISPDFSVAKRGREYFYTETKTPGVANIINWEKNSKDQNGLHGSSGVNNQVDNSLKDTDSEKVIEAQRPQLTSEKKLSGQETKEVKDLSASAKKFLPFNLLAQTNQRELVFSSLGIAIFAGLSGTFLARLRRQIKQKALL